MKIPYQANSVTHESKNAKLFILETLQITSDNPLFKDKKETYKPRNWAAGLRPSQAGPGPLGSLLVKAAKYVVLTFYVLDCHADTSHSAHPLIKLQNFKIAFYFSPQNNASYVIFMVFPLARYYVSSLQIELFL